MERDLILSGYRVCEKGFNSNEIYDEIEKKYSEGMNLVGVGTTGIDLYTGEPIAQDEFLKLAKYLSDKQMYFVFMAGGLRPHAGFTQETAQKMVEIAGDYFLYYASPELGSSFSTKGSGYEETGNPPYENLQHAKDIFLDHIRRLTKENSMGGILKTSVVEASSMIAYECEAGISIPTMEFWPGDIEISAAFTRGTVAAYHCDSWGGYFAHEWYGGLRWDTLKQKRNKVGYDYCYLAGCSHFITESGDDFAGSHTDENFGYDHPVCKHYRDMMAECALFAKNDFRPAGGPKVRVAFVRGNLDGYSFRHSGGSLWRGHSQKEYGYNTPEYTWRILETIQSKRRWCDVQNYGEVDLSGAPGYGLYDVIPATAEAEVFNKYDYLIFVGWNSMTDEIYKNLTAYVKQGGRLFMAAAHLNTSIKRDGSINLLNGGDVSELFGCVLDAENTICREDGFKFKNSIVPEFLYPSLDFACGDPHFAEGYVTYAGVSLTTGVGTGRLSNWFIETDIDAMPISLVENKCGEGYAVLMTNLEYPYGAASTVYQNLVREILTASHRTADIKVYGGDALRFSVYEGDKVYLLNTDFDSPIFATIDYGTHKATFTLEPGEFKAVEKE